MGVYYAMRQYCNYFLDVVVCALMKRKSIIFFFLVFLLSGCNQDTLQTVIVTPTLSQAVASEMDTPVPVERTLVPTVTPTHTSTLTPSPVPTLTATPAPFVCSFLRGRTESGSFSSDRMYEQVNYLVHLPPCYDQYADRAFPVLYLFHGWPLDEHHWQNLGVEVWADDYSGRSITGPYIIVMPGVGSEGLFVNSSGGDNSFEGMVVGELVPRIDATYRTWRLPLARAVGGISRGGVWALEIALRHQDVFGIVGGHSPALALNRPLPQYDPFKLGAGEVVNLRFYLDAGDQDWARASTISFRDFLMALGISVTYQVHEGGHVDALWSSGIADYLLFYAETWPRTYELLPLWVVDPNK